MIHSYDHEITYDPGNRKTIVRDSVGAVTVYEVDEVNAVVAITDAHGGRASYERAANLLGAEPVRRSLSTGAEILPRRPCVQSGPGILVDSSSGCYRAHAAPRS